MQLGWPAALSQLKKIERYSCSLSTTGGRLLLTGSSAEAQTGHSSSPAKSGQSLRYIFVASSDVSAYLFVTRGSYINIELNREQKKLLQRAFVLGKVEVPPSTVFVGHEYVQIGGSEWRGIHCVRYNTYLVFGSQDSPDATASAYEDSIHAGSIADVPFVDKVGGRGADKT